MSSDSGKTIHSDAIIPPALGFAPGMRLDNYELIEKLGRGGMGEVWRARDIPGNREVAMKFVPKDIENAEEEMERVKAMFGQVHALHHESICPLHGMDHTPGFGTYIVMQYIPGITLGKFAREVRRLHGKFPLKTLLEILQPVAAALDYAHRNNVVHRDIKPGNIMIVGDPKTLKIEDIQIIDFGLAATFRASMSRVSQQKFSHSGTRPYMAPEQWEGKKQDGASDQYALAVTVYELLTGEFPFDADDVEVLRLCVLNNAPDPIPGQPAALNAAVLRALAKGRNERFPTCGEFIAAMEKPEIPAPPPKEPSRPAAPPLPKEPLKPGVPPPVEITARLGISEDQKSAQPMVDITDHDLAFLKYWPSLEILPLSGCCHITDAGLGHLRELRQLKSLTLDGCGNITDAGLGYLRELPQLQSLTFVGCGNITDIGLSHLQVLIQLQKLDVRRIPNSTNTGLQKLKESLPECDILTDYYARTFSRGGGYAVIGIFIGIAIGALMGAAINSLMGVAVNSDYRAMVFGFSTLLGIFAGLFAGPAVGSNIGRSFDRKYRSRSAKPEA